MKVRITEECIACGLCVDICPDVFEMGDQIARVKADGAPENFEKAVHQAAEECPASAIIVE